MVEADQKADDAVVDIDDPKVRGPLDESGQLVAAHRPDLWLTGVVEGEDLDGIGVGIVANHRVRR